MTDALHQLERLIDDRDGQADRSALLKALSALSGENRGDPSVRNATDNQLIFDISDLLEFFSRLRSPTGVQRVQIEIIGALVAAGAPIRICRFLEKKGVWVEVPKATFERLIRASREGGSPEDADWRALNDKANAQAGAAATLIPAPGSILITLGSSWWLSDYSLQVRALKDEYGLRYVPFIHDVIPVVAPQLCDKELVGQFTPWICEVIDNADFVLTNSEASKRDILDLADAIGRDLGTDDIAVIPLDADYRSSSTAPTKRISPPRTRPHVLLISTLEVRKNQLAALDAWFDLLSNYRADEIPHLILVGPPGVRSEDIHARINSDPMLAAQVTVRRDVDDAELAELYRESLFTLYPSSYEGWGLPVTEALCYGKVPLVANNSSLPEAGGSFAVYFATGSTVDLIEKLKQLIFDEKFRQRREALIAADFRPRAWIDIANQIAGAVASVEVADRSDPASAYPLAEIGHYYPLKRRATHGQWKGMGSAEGFRRGTDWWNVEEDGCWTQPAGGLLAMSLDPAERYEIAFELASSNPGTIRAMIGIDGGPVLVDVPLAKGGRRWVFAELPAGLSHVVLRLWSDRSYKPDGEFRTLGVGLGGFFALRAGDFEARRTFVEAVALGALGDFNHYRRRDVAESEHA